MEGGINGEVNVDKQINVDELLWLSVKLEDGSHKEAYICSVNEWFCTAVMPFA